MLTWQNLEYRAATADQRRPLSAPARAAQRAGMDPESLIFFGQSPAEFAYLAEAESAEERIKSLLQADEQADGTLTRGEFMELCVEMLWDKSVMVALPSENFSQYRDRDTARYLAIKCDKWR